MTTNGLLVTPDSAILLPGAQTPIQGAFQTPDRRHRRRSGHLLRLLDGQRRGRGLPHRPPRLGDVDEEQPASNPVVAIAADPQTGGYWLSMKDGSVRGFHAPDEGSIAGEGDGSPTLAVMTEDRRPSSGPDLSGGGS